MGEQIFFYLISFLMSQVASVRKLAFRTDRPEVSYEKNVLENFALF